METITDTSGWTIQELVDDHARMGYPDHQIRLHLRDNKTGHGISVDILIPPPSKSAQKARSLFLKTGVVSQKGLSKRTRIISGNSRGSAASSTAVSVAKVPGKTSQEAANEIAKEYNLSQSPDVNAFEIYEKSVLESVSVYFARIHRVAGKTLLDRIIHGSAAVLRELFYVSGSNFEIFQENIIIHKQEGKFKESMLSGDFAEEWNIFQAIDVSLYPWFKPESNTINIQIDAELAEIFLAGKAPIANDWMIEGVKKPIYIDIHEGVYGKRVVSGIFCRPDPKHETFSYMAVVEWIGQGFEGFLFGEIGDSKNAIIMLPRDEDEDEDMSQELIDSIYDPLAEQIEKIVSMAVMYYQTKKDSFKDADYIVTTSRNENPSKKKKEKNKEKTHSYFRVVEMKTPSDRFGFTGKTGNSWSLDHLVSVSGHFRWQPFGPSSGQRKLIWINAYNKGEGVRHRPESNPTLVRLPSPSL